MTEYVILRKSGASYERLASQEAAGAPAAIRACVAVLPKDGVVDGTYVAVPKRSFAEVPMQMETQTRVVLGGEKSTPVAAAAPGLGMRPSDRVVR